MAEKKNDEIQIIMNILINKNEKDYLIVISSNESHDYAIILVQQSSFIYCSKYVLEDFKKINFFKNYSNFGLKQCIDILINLIEEKKNLIQIEEEENKLLKLILEFEINVVGMKFNFPKEKIEIFLQNDNVEQITKKKLIWHSLLYLFKEKEEGQKIKLELEDKIKQLTQEITVLKQNLEEKKIITPFTYDNNGIKNDLKKK